MPGPLELEHLLVKPARVFWGPVDNRALLARIEKHWPS